MKKLLLAVLLSAPLISIAAVTTTAQFNPEKERLPLPDGGIKVVPMKKMAAFDASLNTVLVAKRQIEEKGFYEVDNPEAKVLMNMRNIKALKAGSNNPEDSSVKAIIADVGLAFEFKGAPVDPINIVGYAAAGLYNKGWTGVTEIFTDQR